MHFRQALMFAMSLSVCAVAHAQTPVTSLAAASGQVETGERLIVTTRSGETVRGRLVDLTDVDVRLRNRTGEVGVSAGDILRIERPRDPVWNGALIGAAVGGGLGLVVAATDDCSGRGFGPCFSSAEGAAVAGGILALYGLGIGALVDLFVSRDRLVFEPSSGGAERRVLTTLGPGGRIGGVISIRW